MLFLFYSSTKFCNSSQFPDRKSEPAHSFPVWLGNVVFIIGQDKWHELYWITTFKLAQGIFPLFCSVSKLDSRPGISSVDLSLRLYQENCMDCGEFHPLAGRPGSNRKTSGRSLLIKSVPREQQTSSSEVNHSHLQQKPQFWISSHIGEYWLQNSLLP